MSVHLEDKIPCSLMPGQLVNDAPLSRSGQGVPLLSLGEGGFHLGLRAHYVHARIHTCERGHKRIHRDRESINTPHACMGTCTHAHACKQTDK